MLFSAIRSGRRQGKVLELHRGKLGPVQRHVGLTVELEVRQAYAADLHQVGAMDGRRRAIVNGGLGGDVVVLEDAVAADAQTADELSSRSAAVSL